jgi:hypothetical protein
MTNPIVPGMTVRVIDECELYSEWVEFTVIKRRDKRVDLLSPSGEKTWALCDEIVPSLNPPLRQAS